MVIKYIIRIAIFGVILVVVGCASGLVVDVNQDYKLQDANDEGIVAFSLHIDQSKQPCSSKWDSCRFFIFVWPETEAGIETKNPELSKLNPFSLDPNSEGLYGPATYIAGPLQLRRDLVVWKMPPGRYTVRYWTLSVSGTVFSPKVFTEYIDFVVTKNKVNYLGRLSFDFEMAGRDDMSYTSQVVNKESEDIPRFIETWPQFKGQIQTQLFESGRIPSPN